MMTGQIVDEGGKKVFVIGRKKTTEEQLAELKELCTKQAQGLTSLKSTVAKHETDLSGLKEAKAGTK